MKGQLHMLYLPDTNCGTPMPACKAPGSSLSAEDRAMLQRIEGKLDLLLVALAEEVEMPELTLDGEDLGRERDQSQSLG